jgi:hypothetical protein
MVKDKYKGIRKWTELIAIASIVIETARKNTGIVDAADPAVQREAKRLVINFDKYAAEFDSRPKDKKIKSSKMKKAAKGKTSNKQ